MKAKVRVQDVLDCIASEEEFDGPAPESLIAACRVGSPETIADLFRQTVRATKARISSRVRVLAGETSTTMRLNTGRTP